MRKLVLFLLSILFLAGCRNDKYRNMERQLVQDTLITELSDSSLFYNNISCISCVSGEICFSDYSAGHIVVLDESLRLRCKIGKRGESPNEIVGVVNFAIDEQCFYLLDEGSRSIKKYSSSGDFISTIGISNDISYAPWGRFLYLNSYFFLPNIKGPAISVMNSDGKLVKQFGVNSEQAGGRILLSNGKSGLLAVGIASPIIEEYTLDGVLKKSLIFDELPIVKSIMENRRDSENSFTAIVKDACWSNGGLYILVANEILRFSVEGEIQLDEIYLLPHGFYNSIGVMNEKFYVFNFNDTSIERFFLL